MFLPHGRYKREAERDEFLKAIELARQNYQDPTSAPIGKQEAEDPIKILKIRYAKGEITKEQFDEMMGMLI